MNYNHIVMTLLQMALVVGLIELCARFWDKKKYGWALVMFGLLLLPIFFNFTLEKVLKMTSFQTLELFWMLGAGYLCGSAWGQNKYGWALVMLVVIWTAAYCVPG